MRVEFDSVELPKQWAKRAQEAFKLLEIPYKLSQCQEAIAAACGYKNWHELKTCAAKPSPEPAVKTAKEVDWTQEKIKRFSLSLDEELLYEGIGESVINCLDQPGHKLEATLFGHEEKEPEETTVGGFAIPIFDDLELPHQLAGNIRGLDFDVAREHFARICGYSDYDDLVRCTKAGKLIGERSMPSAPWSSLQNLDPMQLNNFRMNLGRAMDVQMAQMFTGRKEAFDPEQSSYSILFPITGYTAKPSKPHGVYVYDGNPPEMTFEIGFCEQYKRFINRSDEGITTLEIALSSESEGEHEWMREFVCRHEVYDIDLYDEPVCNAYLHGYMVDAPWHSEWDPDQLSQAMWIYDDDAVLSASLINKFYMDRPTEVRHGGVFVCASTVNVGDISALEPMLEMLVEQAEMEFTNDNIRVMLEISHPRIITHSSPTSVKPEEVITGAQATAMNDRYYRYFDEEIRTKIPRIAQEVKLATVKGM